MAGQRLPKKVLNETLIFLCKLLNSKEIKDWFIFYGTLLGIVRENGCIDNDDDIDIIISEKHYDIVKKLLIENGFELETGYGINTSTNILKTKVKNENGQIKYSSIDIYMSSFENENDIYDKWNRVLLKDCFLDNREKTFIEKEWEGVKLYLPKDCTRKLENAYGKDWTIKQNKKINFTYLHQNLGTL